MAQHKNKKQLFVPPQEDLDFMVAREIMEKGNEYIGRSLNGLERMVIGERNRLSKVDMGFLYQCYQCRSGARYRTWNNLNIHPLTCNRPHCGTCRNPLRLIEAKLAHDLGVYFLDGYRCTNCKNAYPHVNDGKCPGCLSAVEVLKRFYPLARFWTCRWCSTGLAYSEPQREEFSRCRLCEGPWQPVASPNEQVPQLWC